LKSSGLTEHTYLHTSQKLLPGISKNEGFGSLASSFPLNLTLFKDSIDATRNANMSPTTHPQPEVRSFVLSKQHIDALPFEDFGGDKKKATGG
jgi:hypothetical protein